MATPSVWSTGRQLSFLHKPVWLNHADMSHWTRMGADPVSEVRDWWTCQIPVVSEVDVQKLTILDCGDYFWLCLISFWISLGKDLHLNCRKRSLPWIWTRVQRLNLVQGSLCNDITFYLECFVADRLFDLGWTAFWPEEIRKTFPESLDHSIGPFLHLSAWVKWYGLSPSEIITPNYQRWRLNWLRMARQRSTL